MHPSLQLEEQLLKRMLVTARNALPPDSKVLEGEPRELREALESIVPFSGAEHNLFFCPKDQEICHGLRSGLSVIMRLHIHTHLLHPCLQCIQVGRPGSKKHRQARQTLLVMALRATGKCRNRATQRAIAQSIQRRA